MQPCNHVVPAAHIVPAARATSAADVVPAADSTGVQLNGTWDSHAVARSIFSMSRGGVGASRCPLTCGSKGLAVPLERPMLDWQRVIPTCGKVTRERRRTGGQVGRDINAERAKRCNRVLCKKYTTCRLPAHNGAAPRATDARAGSQGRVVARHTVPHRSHGPFPATQWQ